MSKVIAFHGADNKVGTTMITQSIAESIAKKLEDRKVLFISLTGDKNCEFNKNSKTFIKNFKANIEGELLTGDNLERSTYRQDNLYIIGGIGNEKNVRDYFPKHGEYILNKAREVFDLILVDTGSELDQGLALGGLIYSDLRYLVMTQQETAIASYEQKIDDLKFMDILFEKVILNKYLIEDYYNLKYIKNRLNLEKECLIVGYSDLYRQAEREKMTFFSMKSSKVKKDIEKISNDILMKFNVNIKLEERKKKWISFI